MEKRILPPYTILLTGSGLLLISFPFLQLTGKLHVIGYWILFIGFAVFALAIVLAFLISGNISQKFKAAHRQHETILQRKF